MSPLVVWKPGQLAAPLPLKTFQPFKDMSSLSWPSQHLVLFSSVPMGLLSGLIHVMCFGDNLPSIFLKGIICHRQEWDYLALFM